MAISSVMLLHMLVINLLYNEGMLVSLLKWNQSLCWWQSRVEVIHFVSKAWIVSCCDYFPR
jgi:hypothetical protein